MKKAPEGAFFMGPRRAGGLLVGRADGVAAVFVLEPAKVEGLGDTLAGKKLQPCE